MRRFASAPFRDRLSRQGGGVDVVLRALLVTAPHGVLTLKTAARHGLGRRELGRLVDSGVLVRVCPGGFVPAPVWAGATPTERHALRAAGLGLTLGPTVAVSHLSAAALLGIPLLRQPSGKVHLTRVAPGQGRQRAAYDIHQTYGAHAWVPGQPWCVIPLLAAFGVAEIWGFVAGVVALDAVLHRRLAGEQECRLWLDRLRRRPKVALLARVVAAADSLAESPLETQVRLVVILLGYRVRAQVVIRTVAGEFVARVDLLIEELGVIIEVDGAVKYVRPDGTGAPEELLREKRREKALVDLGYGVVRADSHDVQHPTQLDERIRDAARRAQPRSRVGS